MLNESIGEKCYSPRLREYLLGLQFITEPPDVLNRGMAIHTCIFATKVRGTIIADFERGVSSFYWCLIEQTARLLEPELLLIRIALTASAIARSIAYAIEQPEGVDVNELVIRPAS